MQRLTASQVAAFRIKLLALQGGKCALCKQPLEAKDSVLDHDHVTGVVRGVLHRGCNSMLGKIENHRRIAKLTSVAALSQFLAGVLPYLDGPGHGVLYPTFRTTEEKRLARNLKARKKRAATKEVD